MFERPLQSAKSKRYEISEIAVPHTPTCKLSYTLIYKFIHPRILHNDYAISLIVAPQIIIQYINLIHDRN